MEQLEHRGFPRGREQAGTSRRWTGREDGALRRVLSPSGRRTLTSVLRARAHSGGDCDVSVDELRACPVKEAPDLHESRALLGSVG